LLKEDFWLIVTDTRSEDETEIRAERVFGREACAGNQASDAAEIFRRVSYKGKSIELFRILAMSIFGKLFSFGRKNPAQQISVEELIARGDALHGQGEANDSLSDLMRAGSAYKAALEAESLMLPSERRAEVLKKLGSCLAYLGELSGDLQYTHEAISTLRLALSECDFSRSPDLWVQISCNLGGALEFLGDYSGDKKVLNESLAVFGLALQKIERDGVPVPAATDLWAKIQFNRANALRSLGECSESSAHLQESAAVFRAVMDSAASKPDSDMQMMAQVNLSTTLRCLGELLDSLPHLEEAASFARAASEGFSRDEEPYKWVVAQSKLGEALLVIGRVNNSSSHLDSSVDVWKAVVEVCRSENFANGLDTALVNLKKALDLRAKLP
jgi:tetratricopeptide (TPR) repeat protein